MNLNVEDKSKLQGEYITQTQDERNNGILKSWLPLWVQNSFENWNHLKELSMSRPISVGAIPKVPKNTPAVIVGSGPSLDETAPFLKDWEGAIFACGSNAIIPTRWGHQPEYICVFDAGDSLYPKMMNYDWKGSTMLSHPSASPKIIQTWKYDCYFYLMLHFGFQWFEEILPLAYGDFCKYPNEVPINIKIAVGNAGCTVNNAIQLAKYIGYSPLYLIGVDLGYPNDKERCTRYIFSNGGWKEIPPDSYRDRKLHLSENGILTTEEQIEYKNALLNVYKWDKPQLIDCSKGIITELPKLDFKEVVKRYANGEQEYFERYYRTPEQIEKCFSDFQDRQKALVTERNENKEDKTVCSKTAEHRVENRTETKEKQDK